MTNGRYCYGCGGSGAARNGYECETCWGSGWIEYTPEAEQVLAEEWDAPDESFVLTLHNEESRRVALRHRLEC